MNNLLLKSQKFVKRNSATLLTVTGAAGVIATTVTAVKATPKAMLLLEQAKEVKREELTKVEKVKIAGPVYIPSLLLGSATIACVFGANVLNKRAQASLMSAYALVDSSYKDYKAKINELYGEEANNNVKAEIAKDKYEENPIEVHDDNHRLFYDDYSGRYFEADPTTVQRAEYEINRALMLDDGVYLDQWYELLDMEPLEHGSNFGWNTSTNSAMYWQTWVDFHHQKVVMDDGLECTIISFMQEPYADFEEWY